jgi:hypothetical protein
LWTPLISEHAAGRELLQENESVAKNFSVAQSTLNFCDCLPHLVADGRKFLLGTRDGRIA